MKRCGRQGNRRNRPTKPIVSASDISRKIGQESSLSAFNEKQGFIGLSSEFSKTTKPCLEGKAVFRGNFLAVSLSYLSVIYGYSETYQ
jgi:hypothetical protein